VKIKIVTMLRYARRLQIELDWNLTNLIEAKFTKFEIFFLLIG